MIIYILVNIAVVLLIVGFDLYRHQFNQLKFSSILLAISLNSIIDIYVIDKFNFITLSTVLLFLIWTFLQIYLNKKLYPFQITEQKFIATIFAIVISLSQFITDISSEQSVYMSIPYLAPAIFIFGAMLVFIGTFKMSEIEHISLLTKVKRPITTGTLVIILSFIIMMILTPFWYVYVIVYFLFIAFILWQGIFFVKRKQ
ncbi:hypothetical protein HLA86_07220 [Staphylococcus caprae]|uniref:hypothetical protein n=1 Tax=Staphylococcus caprae TaxID=29380 RepID=UPI001C838658|nr:hypothetical protein [Staphylococcus caprae]MBX5319356.1 hypothetical protein [Staphylococcus caprae]